jgi:hypothetical protein
MKLKMNLALAAVLPLALSSLCHAQDMETLNTQWKQTVSAARQGNDEAARASLAQFTASAASYVQAHGRSWQIEYLVGSVDCLFSDRRATGAQFLQDILANNRSLNQEGQAELRHQIAECTDRTQHSSAANDTSTPTDVTEVSTHYQVGITGDMKGGFDDRPPRESAGAVSPIPASELAARLVPVDQPEKALHDAAARISPTARGATEAGFAVINASGSAEEAGLTAACLERYAQPLKSEFQIDSSRYVVTAYSVTYSDAVYEYAQKLHGLKLPIGVLAYSIPDDMSLVALDSGAQCGSMAHELVHLLIKQKFPGAPAWLEEGLASEVAIADPTPQKFRFAWSWRDDRLRDLVGLQISVNDLLNMPWSALNAYDRSEARRAEANQAMAAVFIRYLDAKGKLPDIYFAVRDQHVSPDLAGFKSYQAIVEQKMGMPLDTIQTDFSRWFQSQVSMHPAPRIVPPMQGAIVNDVPNAAAQTEGSQMNVASPALNIDPSLAPINTSTPNAAAQPSSPNTPRKPN